MAKKLYKSVNGERIALTDDEADIVRTQWAENDAKQQANQYKEDRLMQYPNWPDQLDQIFHEGIDKWKETIQAVKDANPKP
jgi:hypothetical protein